MKEASEDNWLNIMLEKVRFSQSNIRFDLVLRILDKHQIIKNTLYSLCSADYDVS